MTDRTLPIVRRASICTCFALALMSAGCLLPGEGSRQITFKPQARNIEYEYKFEQAYAAPSPEGGYDLVLTSGFEIHSPVQQTRVYPAVVPKVSQVMYIHVSWRPAMGSKNDYPAATNSRLRWYLFEGEPGATTNRAAYDGVGYVAVEVGEHESLFQLRDVQVAVDRVEGSMRDPLGPSHATGEIRARNDEPAVRRILQELAKVEPGSAVSSEVAASR